ncbi:hypothetical protein JGF05_23335, partial [Salmonella enterica subsp. enterica serovar Agona]|nr:hypothetical protein [Salmonella enterica subsp. enterica serovar Agona]
KKEVFRDIDDLVNKIKEQESIITSLDPDYAYPNYEKKAKVQVYLSCNKESDSRIGISMKNKTIDTDDDCFSEIKEFISKI